MKPRSMHWSMAAVLVASLWLCGCGGDASSAMPAEAPRLAVVPDSLSTDTLVRDSPVAAPAVLETSLPLKPEAVRTALKAQWEAAEAVERRLLLSTRLQGWLQQPGGITDAQWPQLDAKERLGWLLFHPEESADAPDPDNAAAGQVDRISRTLPAATDGTYGDRQIKAVYQDSVAVRGAILELLGSQKTASPSLLRCISWFKFKATIPAIVAIYRGQSTKDDLLLTTLVALMERNNYWPWFKSPACTGMLIDPSGTIPLTAANADEIIAQAQRFHASAKR